MNTARELLKQHKKLDSKTSVAELREWCAAVTTFLQQCDKKNLDLIGVSFALGYAEGLLKHHDDMEFRKEIRAWKVREGRLKADLGDSLPEEQITAAAKAHQLKDEGYQNFVAMVAREYDKDPKTIRKWMKQHPATRD